MIDLCVVNYMTRSKLKRLVDLLYKDDDPDVFRLWVADNGSHDGSVEWLKETLYPIDGIFYNENVGYATGCNMLAQQGEGDIIGLLNADVWLTTEDLRQIQHRFDTFDVDILGPKQRDERGKITHGGILGTNDHPKHRGWQESDPNDNLYKTQDLAVTVSGSAYFIRRSVWNALTDCPMYSGLDLVQSNNFHGAFLPTFHYFEETFCSYHATAHGYKILYDGTISIGHSWHASSKKGSVADQLFPVSQSQFREACDLHGILHD